jgi:hypothetical protein
MTQIDWTPTKLDDEFSYFIICLTSNFQQSMQWRVTREPKGSTIEQTKQSIEFTLLSHNIPAGLVAIFPIDELPKWMTEVDWRWF